jgi:hypothetical protein
MNRKFFRSAGLSAALACMATIGLPTQSTGGAQASPWIGVWQSTLDGQPGATLTLAQDTGALGGTLVLDIVRADSSGQAYLAASEPHTLIDPQLAGNTLNFSVRQLRASAELLRFTVVLMPDGKARIHCTNCSGAPVVDLTPAR